jgi:hypothetical protein
VRFNLSSREPLDLSSYERLCPIARAEELSVGRVNIGERLKTVLSTSRSLNRNYCHYRFAGWFYLPIDRKRHQ